MLKKALSGKGLNKTEVRYYHYLMGWASHIHDRARCAPDSYSDPQKIQGTEFMPKNIDV